MPFVRTQQRGLSARFLALLSAAIVGLLLLLLAGLALANFVRTMPRTATAQPTPSSPPLLPLAVSSPPPTAAATPSPAAAGPPANPPATSTAIAPPSLTAAASTSRTAKVANTGGQGVNMRRTPGVGGEVVTTVAEDATVRVLGPEERGADGRIWRQVEDARGNQGWVLADVLVEQR